jgi:hypothetical protein
MEIIGRFDFSGMDFDVLALSNTDLMPQMT